MRDALVWAVAATVGAVIAVVLAATMVAIAVVAAALALSVSVLRARRSVGAAPDPDLLEARHAGGHSWVAYAGDVRR